MATTKGRRQIKEQFEESVRHMVIRYLRKYVVDPKEVEQFKFAASEYMQEELINVIKRIRYEDVYPEEVKNGN